MFLTLRNRGNILYIRMKRRNFLAATLATTAYVTVGLPASESVLAATALVQPPAKQGVLAAIRKVNDYWINQNTNPGSYSWLYATYFSGNLAAYEATGQQRYLTYAQTWAQRVNYSLHGGSTTRNADDQAVGQVYIGLYKIKNDPSFLTQITASIDAMVKSSRNSDWWWVDALNMAMPCFAQLGSLYQDNTYYAKMYSLYNYTRRQVGGRGLYDTQTHLWFRDSSFLPPYASPNGKNVYWSRGNGWAFAALAKVIAALPATEGHRPEYVTTFQAMAAALRSTQRVDGFWNVDLGDPQDLPGPETSGTAFFVYGLAWGLNAGLLDRTTYLPVVTRGWNGLVNTAVQANGFLGYVQGTGDSPQSSQPVTVHSTTPFGVGAFLLAGNQVAKLT